MSPTNEIPDETTARRRWPRDVTTELRLHPPTIVPMTDEVRRRATMALAALLMSVMEERSSQERAA